MPRLRKVSGKCAIRALEHLGFSRVRQRGSHVVMKKTTEFDGDIPLLSSNIFLRTIPLILLIRLVALRCFGLNHGLWRYASLRDLMNIGLAVIVSSAAIWGTISALPWAGYPRSVYLIDGFLLLLVLSVLRVSRRIYAVLMHLEKGSRRVLIIGAGDAGEMIAREMNKGKIYDRRPVAFIDDDPKKRSKKLHNIPVTGNCDEMDSALKIVQADEILIAIPSATQEQLKRIIKRCKSLKLPIKSLPNLTAIMNGKASVTDIRNLDIEDLIGRAEIHIIDPKVAEKIKGKKVLITGAGGETFVLDMGEPIKIIDLARTMIILSGFSPDEEVPIHLIGLRPGKKLVESLFEENEEVVQTRHEKVQLAQNGGADFNLIAYIKKFAAIDSKTDPKEIKAVLKELIPSYQNEGISEPPSVQAEKKGDSRKALSGLSPFH